MAERLKVTGISRKRIYQLSRVIESEFFRMYKASLAGVQGGSKPDTGFRSMPKAKSSATQLRDCLVDKEIGRPLILMIGGVTGSGKSTLANEVCQRLGINRLIPTDFIRHRMRAFFSREVMPSIYCSSFEVGYTATRFHDEPSDPTLSGFLDQARNVLVGVRAVLARSLRDGHSTAVEGVHIVPGWIPTSVKGAIVVSCLLRTEKIDAHVSNFWIRSATSKDHRPARRYLRSLSEIRRIQDYLVEQAKKAGVPVIETSQKEEAIDSLIRLVLGKVEQCALVRRRRQQPSLPGGLHDKSGRRVLKRAVREA